MKYIFSYMLYVIGDIISLTIMRWGRGYGWSIYNKIMLWSADLDDKGKIWKFAKSTRKNKNGNSKRSRKSKTK